MDTFTYEVTMRVTVPALDESDAEEAIRDTFSEGVMCGLGIDNLVIEVTE